MGRRQVKEGSRFLHIKYKGSDGTLAVCEVTRVTDAYVYYKIFTAPGQVSRETRVRKTAFGTIVHEWLGNREDT